MKHLIQQRISGFTIIELMIGVAIIGVLAGVAIPAYNVYMTKAKVTELLNVASTAKHSVAEYRTSTGSMPTSNQQAGINDTESTFVSNVTVGDDGVISISGNTSTLGLDSPLSIEFTPSYSNGVVSWSCSSTGDNKFVPPDCRNATAQQQTPEEQRQGLLSQIMDLIQDYYSAPPNERSGLLGQIMDLIQEYFSL